LNFFIPAHHCVGNVNFTVTIFDPAHPDDPSYAASGFKDVRFEDVPQVRVHAVLVHYTGPGTDILPPSLEDLDATLGYVRRVYPTSGFKFTAVTEVDFPGDLTLRGPGCGPGWSQLIELLANIRNAASFPPPPPPFPPIVDRDVYVGLLPSGVPVCDAFPCTLGCGGGGLAAGFVGDGQTLAQEIAHAFDRKHAPCIRNPPPNIDLSYPQYPGLPPGSIGELGFDVENHQLEDPRTTYDFMSYCRPQWVSPYTYAELKVAIAARIGAPQFALAGSTVAAERAVLNFRIHRLKHVELRPSFHLPGLTATDADSLSEFSCELLDSAGETIEAHRCGMSDPHQDRYDSYLDFHEVVPWNPQTHSLAFLRLGEMIATLEIENTPPKVGSLYVNEVTGHDDVFELRWQASHPSRALTYLVRYSHDGGGTWRVVGVNLTASRLLVNMAHLPGGHDCMFEVAASSGIRTATARTDAFVVPRKAVQAHVLAPSSGSEYTIGDPVTFQGFAFSPDRGNPSGENIIWSSNLDGLLGIGYQTVVRTLSVGRHRITLSAPDTADTESTATILITIRGRR
jgi:hypothetical protein